MPDECADCGKPRPDMHNSREVEQGWWPFRKVVTKRFPGYICVECWKAANPLLWPAKVRDAVQ